MIIIFRFHNKLQTFGTDVAPSALVCVQVHESSAWNRINCLFFTIYFSFGRTTKKILIRFIWISCNGPTDATQIQPHGRALIRGPHEIYGCCNLYFCWSWFSFFFLSNMRENCMLSFISNPLRKLVNERREKYVYKSLWKCVIEENMTQFICGET